MERLDTIRVKGRIQAGKIRELLALSNEVPPMQKAFVADYAEGLVHWRAGEFDLAASSFERAAEADHPSSNFLKRGNARKTRLAPNGGQSERCRRSRRNVQSGELRRLQ
jgi:adenylate cyclase